MEPPFKIYQYYLKNTLKPLAYVLNWFHKHIMEETCYEKIIRQLAMTVLILCLFTSCNYNTRNTGDTNKSLKDEKYLRFILLM